MKRLNSFFLVIVIALYLWSCSTQGNPELAADNLFIDLEKAESTSWEDLFQEVEVIPLEFTDESMLTGIEEILIQDEYYLIFDQKAQVLYKFDSDGNYIAKLDKSGDGPDEYQMIYDVAINPSSGNYELLSGFGSFYIYDKDFRWVETIDFPDMISATQFDYFSEDLILLYSAHDRDYNLRLYSRSENKHVSRMKQPTKSITELNGLRMLNNPLINTPDGILFCVPIINSVYAIGLDSLKFKYQWDIGGQFFDESGIKDGDPRQKLNDFYKNMLKNGFTSLMNYYENQNLIFAQYSLKQQFGTILYHKESKDYKILYDNTIGEASITILEDGYISYMSTDRLPKTLENSVSDYVLRDDSNAGHENNPVLLKYTFNRKWID